MEFYAHVDDDIMAQWAKSATQDLDKRVTALEESRRPKAHAPTIASQSEAGRKGEVDHLAALVDDLRADIARKNVLVESQAQTIKYQAQKREPVGASSLKDLQDALAKKSHVIAKQDEKIKNLRNQLAEKDRNNGNLAQKMNEERKRADRAERALGVRAENQGNALHDLRQQLRDTTAKLIKSETQLGDAKRAKVAEQARADRLRRTLTRVRGELRHRPEVGAQQHLDQVRGALGMTTYPTRRFR